MRSSFFVHECWMNPGKKWPLRILVQPKDTCLARSSRSASLSGKLWQYFVAMYSQKGFGRENALSWQDIAEMHAKSANFGKICFLCMLKARKSAVGEYISRISCPEGPLFLSGVLKSCIMSKFCRSFAVLPFVRRGVGARPALWFWTQQSVVVLGASKRYGCPSRGGASVSLLGSELGKCGPPPPHVGAQALWGSAGASIMRLIRRRRRRVAHPQV